MVGKLRSPGRGKKGKGKGSGLRRPYRPLIPCRPRDLSVLGLLRNCSRARERAARDSGSGQVRSGNKSERSDRRTTKKKGPRLWPRPLEQHPGRGLALLVHLLPYERVDAGDADG